MEKLLEFGNGQPFDVPLLEQTVRILYDGSHPQHPQAHQVIMALQNHGETWLHVDKILEQSQDPQTKFIALQVLENTIKSRWKVLPEEQRTGIRNYVVEKVITLSQTETTYAAERPFIGKLNLILVDILKQEWPHNWPTFIPDLVGSSKTSESLCENNMQILRLLSEEVFDFSKDEMTAKKTKVLKTQLTEEFRQIFELSQLVLDRSTRPSLLSATLDMLLRYLSWIHLGFIFETPLISRLLTKFLPVRDFRNKALACLNEIAQLRDGTAPYEQVLVNMYCELVGRLTGKNDVAPLLPLELDLAREFERVSQDDKDFIQLLSIFFTSFLAGHLPSLEQPTYHSDLLTGLAYLVQISKVDDPEIFKICLEYWNILSNSIYQTECAKGGIGGGGGLHFGGGGGGDDNNNNNDNDVLVTGNRLLLNQQQHQQLHQNSMMNTPRKLLYKPILSAVRNVMISNMAKPEEVLVAVDMVNEVVERERTKDTDAIAQYNTMRETLVYLAHIDYQDTEAIMLAKLARQCDRQKNEFNWKDINTLGWAIGSISGAMSEEDEKRFLVNVLKDLLGLCEYVRGKENKAVVASNIMYVVGQYPRFLRMHWRFLKTVVSKLFEFMHEMHPGVQDMACDTFLKLAKKCRRKFVIIQPADTVAFIDALLQNIPQIISDLEVHQIQTLYEACAVIIVASPDPKNRETLLAGLMALPNQHWRTMMHNAQRNVESLQDPVTVRDIGKTLRTNVKVCSAMGHAYLSQLAEIYRDMLNVYKVYSEYISLSVQQNGKVVLSYSNIKPMRGVKTEVLTLLDTYISKIEDNDTLMNSLLGFLHEAIVLDYKNSVPDARDPMVLQLFATIISKLKQESTPTLPSVLECLFQPTLAMIASNFEDFPEFRLTFYTLLGAINEHCFETWFRIPQETQKQVIDSLCWGFKHTERGVAEKALEILHRMLVNVASSPPQFQQQFYKSYLMALIEDILYVLTDRAHKSGFKLHSVILRVMFVLVETNQVQVPLFDVSTTVPNMTNQDYVREYVSNLIAGAFPNLSKNVIVQFVQTMVDPSRDLPTFKQILRDFLIQLKEFSGDTNAELFIEENEADLKLANMQLMEQRRQVPGLLNPYQLPADMAGDDDF